MEDECVLIHIHFFIIKLYIAESDNTDKVHKHSYIFKRKKLRTLTKTK